MAEPTSPEWKKLQVDRHQVALARWEALRDKSLVAVEALEAQGNGHLTEELKKLAEAAEKHAAHRRGELEKLNR